MVYLSRLEVTEKYLNDVRAFAPQAMIIYDTVDLHHLREIREAKLKNSVQLYEKAMETKRRELALMNYVDCTLVVSQLEKRLLEREQPDLKNIEFFPMPREIYGAAQNFAERQNMVFIGGFEHPPNVDAVLYFVQEIFPRVKQAIGQLKFFVIGNKAPQEILDLATEDVVIAGYVPELGEYFNHCKLSVAPLRYGAGIKGKILTSCCYGLPVVATPIAVEGMGLQDGHDVLVGDTAERFAQQVIEVYRDEGLWTRISQNSLATVASRYSMEAVTGQFGQLLNRLRATAAK
ncbi:MAG: glycosyltransferase family 4 protein [Microcoleaceae cyanobacterium]